MTFKGVWFRLAKPYLLPAQTIPFALSYLWFCVAKGYVPYSCKELSESKGSRLSPLHCYVLDSQMPREGRLFPWSVAIFAGILYFCKSDESRRKWLTQSVIAKAAWIGFRPQPLLALGESTPMRPFQVYFSLSYSSSLTGSSHSLLWFSPGASMAKWANQLSAEAPCQCFTLAGMLTTSPGWSLRAGLPHS